MSEEIRAQMVFGPNMLDTLHVRCEELTRRGKEQRVLVQSVMVFAQRMRLRVAQTSILGSRSKPKARRGGDEQADPVCVKPMPRKVALNKRNSDNVVVVTAPADQLNERHTC